MIKRSLASLLLLSLLLILLSGCQKGADLPKNAPAPTPPSPGMAGGTTSPAPANAALPSASDEVKFVDITQQAGITFQHFSGARGKLYMPEIETPGCAFLDYDNDGKPDMLLINGADWPEIKTGRRKSLSALYHNEGGGKFREVTQGSGLDIEMHTMGVTVGDYDNDGFDDIYITCVYGPSRLFHNEGGTGRFRDVSKESGTNNRGTWGSGAAFVDYDKDGKLDLVVGNYCKWTPQTDQFCSVYQGKKSYCTPNVYDGESVRLYHNEGGGRFKEVGKEAGLVNPPGKTWGVVILDYDGDGWPDIALANDLEPNCLFHNEQNGTFKEVGLVAGIALSESGNAKAGMGMDAADIDGSGQPSLIVTNFTGEGVSLLQNQGGMFLDSARTWQIYDSTLLKMGWGTLFFDYNLDGRPDALVCNGHLYENVNKFQPDVTFAESPQLFRNAGGKFEEVSESRGEDLIKPLVARGSAYADIDGDGDLDLLIMENNGQPRLLRNDGGNANRWLRLHTIGVKSNRSGIGVKVTVEARGARQTQWVKSSASFLSCPERTLTFGMGLAEQADRVTITWPSGQIDTLLNVKTGQTLNVQEGKPPTT